MALHCSQTLARAGKRVKHLDGRRRCLSATAAAARSPSQTFSATRLEGFAQIFPFAENELNFVLALTLEEVSFTLSAVCDSHLRINMFSHRSLAPKWQVSINLGSSIKMTAQDVFICI